MSWIDPKVRSDLFQFAHPLNRGCPPHLLRLIECVAPPRAPHFSLLVQRKVSKRNTPRHPGFAARNLIRIAHPSGQPAAVTPLRSVSSLHHCSRGRRTRAVPGPLRLSARASCFALPPASMQSSPHPCGSLPCTTIPLGLLNGGDGALDRLMLNRRPGVV